MRKLDLCEKNLDLCVENLEKSVENLEKSVENLEKKCEKQFQNRPGSLYRPLKQLGENSGFGNRCGNYQSFSYSDTNSQD